jgi:diadenosine tetraphosphatase ApaH/serine/threonine PP2A family protein phosphatase
MKVFSITLQLAATCLLAQALDPIPKCKKIKLAQLEGVKRIGKGNLAGDCLEFECKKKFPFAVSGDSKICCGFDSQWSGEPLKCSKEPLLIVDPTHPPVECPLASCRMFCPNGFKIDALGCETCECAEGGEPERCPLLGCAPGFGGSCENYPTDESGCRTSCDCLDDIMPGRCPLLGCAPLPGGATCDLYPTDENGCQTSCDCLAMSAVGCPLLGCPPLDIPGATCDLYETDENGCQTSCECLAMSAVGPALEVNVLGGCPPLGCAPLLGATCDEYALDDYGCQTCDCLSMSAVGPALWVDENGVEHQEGEGFVGLGAPETTLPYLEVTEKPFFDISLLEVNPELPVDPKPEE